ncbi:MAG TPA: acetyl-coenzyme A synthetase N-terminal domain-containing protein, partial [Dongiaceae bacterium]
MTDNSLFPVSDDAAKAAWIDRAKYERLYQQSIADPEGFWREQGKRIVWMKPYSNVKDVDFAGKVHVRWFYDGTLNASVN